MISIQELLTFFSSSERSSLSAMPTAKIHFPVTCTRTRARKSPQEQNRNLTILTLVVTGNGYFLQNLSAYFPPAWRLTTYPALVLQGFRQLLTVCRGGGRQTAESQQHQADADGHDAKSKRKRQIDLVFDFVPLKKKRGGSGGTMFLFS